MADCTTYKQGMKSLGYAPDEEDMSQMEEHEFYSDYQNRCEMLLLQSRGALQDGLYIVLGISQERESPQAQVGVGGGAEPEKQTN